MQGGKVLLIAESRAYFTVYRTITDTGMRAYQLDRDGAHASKTAPSEVHAPVPSVHLQLQFHPIPAKSLQACSLVDTSTASA